MQPTVSLWTDSDSLEAWQTGGATIPQQGHEGRQGQQGLDAAVGAAAWQEGGLEVSISRVKEQK